MVVAMQEKPMSARVKCMVTPVHRHFTDIYLHVDKYTHIPKKGNTDNKKTLCYYSQKHYFNSSFLPCR